MSEAQAQPLHATNQKRRKALTALAAIVVVGGLGWAAYEWLVASHYESTDNAYQTHSLHFRHFSPRKAIFFMYSMAYVILPGGFGTLDELFEALTLIQTHKLPPAPIILVGSEFWGGLIDWIREHPLAAGTINPGDLELFNIEDDPDRVVELLLDFHRKHPVSALRPPALTLAK